MSKAKWLIMFLLALTMAVPAFAVELSLGGFPSFMRTRVRYIQGATFISALTEQNARDLGFDSSDDRIFFADTTLRLTPQLVLSDSVTIRAQLNVFDNNIWGGSTSNLLGGGNTVINSNISFSDRFRGAILTGPRAIDDPGFFDVRMLHADIVLPNNLGFVRIGRQPFDWGLGIVANGGWDPYSDLGFVLDRFLYLKSFAAGSGSLTFVFVSDIFSGGNSVVTGGGTGYDGGAVALIYNHPNVGGTNFTIGGYVFPYIHQRNFGSSPSFGGASTAAPNGNAFVSDVDLDKSTLWAAMLDVKSDMWRFAFEVQGFFGELDIAGSTVDIDHQWAGAARVEVYPGWPVKLVALEGGYVSGDDLDKDGIQGGTLTFNPAYNIDSLLFKHMIPNIYQQEGSVINAFYARLWSTVKLADPLSANAQVLVAWNTETDNPYPGIEELDRYMGTEAELTLTWHVHPGVNIDLIGGIVFTGDSLNELLEQQAVNNVALAQLQNPDRDIELGNVNYSETPWTVQGRLMIFIDQFFK